MSVDQTIEPQQKGGVSSVDTQFRAYKTKNELRGLALAGASFALNAAYAAAALPAFKDDLIIPGLITGMVTSVGCLASGMLASYDKGGRCYSPDFTREKINLIEKVFNEKLGDVELSVNNFDSSKFRALAYVGADRNLEFNNHYTDALDIESYETLVRHEVSHVENLDVFRTVLFGALSYLPTGSLAGVMLVSGQFKEAALGAVVSAGQFVLNREFSVTIEERAFVQSTLRDEDTSVRVNAVADMYEQSDTVRSENDLEESRSKKWFPTHPSRQKIANVIDRTFC